jgi:hypothetical protein
VSFHTAESIGTRRFTPPTSRTTSPGRISPSLTRPDDDDIDDDDDDDDDDDSPSSGEEGGGGAATAMAASADDDDGANGRYGDTDRTRTYPSV